jgi:hypothetical protein
MKTLGYGSRYFVTRYRNQHLQTIHLGKIEYRGNYIIEKQFLKLSDKKETKLQINNNFFVTSFGEKIFERESIEESGNICK